MFKSYVYGITFLLATSSTNWCIIQWQWRKGYYHVKNTWLQNPMVVHTRLQVWKPCYSKTRLSWRWWSSGISIICVIEGVMGLIFTSAPQWQVCLANFVIWAILTTSTSTPSFVLQPCLNSMPPHLYPYYTKI
jgi:hypothetical protein